MTETDQRSRSTELIQPQLDSDDPDYLAWVERRIVEAQEQLKDPAQRIPAEELWRALGVERPL